MLHQPTARLHQPLVQAGQGPIVDPFGQHRPPPQIAQVIGGPHGLRFTVSYWLDLGNNADSGQFILGEPLNERNRRAKLRLRSAAELLPEIVDPNLDND
jgi:hypothetical protein